MFTGTIVDRDAERAQAGIQPVCTSVFKNLS